VKRVLEIKLPTFPTGEPRNFEDSPTRRKRMPVLSPSASMLLRNDSTSPAIRCCSSICDVDSDDRLNGFLLPWEPCCGADCFPSSLPGEDDDDTLRKWGLAFLR
jgi:hypothetical protein